MSGGEQTQGPRASAAQVAADLADARSEIAELRSQLAALQAQVQEHETVLARKLDWQRRRALSRARG